MATARTMRRMGAVVLFGTASAILAACGPPLIDEADTEKLWPVCMLHPARAFETDGTPVGLVAFDGATGRACMCMTEEEWQTDALLPELRDKALEGCRELAAPYPTSECQEEYDAHTWDITVTRVQSEEWDWLLEGDPLSCGDDTDDAQCAAIADGVPRAWLGCVFGILLIGGLRRRMQLSSLGTDA